MPAASSESSLARIAYVTNTWWPKVDGAAIAVAGHVRHFVAAGHPVLVVRPSFAADSPLTCRTHASGDRTDPMPPTPLLTFVTFRMTGTRGGGYEPGIVLSDFGRVERAILAWAPDILIVRLPFVLLLVLSLGSATWSSFCSDSISITKLGSISITEPEGAMFWLIP